MNNDQIDQMLAGAEQMVQAANAPVVPQQQPDVRSLIQQEVQRALAAFVQNAQFMGGTPGRDGRDGIDVNPVEVKALVEEVVAKIPKPKDGRDGRWL